MVQFSSAAVLNRFDSVATELNQWTPFSNHTSPDTVNLKNNICIVLNFIFTILIHETVTTSALSQCIMFKIKMKIRQQNKRYLMSEHAEPQEVLHWERHRKRDWITEKRLRVDMGRWKDQRSDSSGVIRCHVKHTVEMLDFTRTSRHLLPIPKFFVILQFFTVQCLKISKCVSLLSLTLKAMPAFWRW